MVSDTGCQKYLWNHADNIVKVIFMWQEHGADKMYMLNPGKLPTNEVTNIIFICRPKLSLMESVAQNVLR